MKKYIKPLTGISVVELDCNVMDASPVSIINEKAEEAQLVKHIDGAEVEIIDGDVESYGDLW